MLLAFSINALAQNKKFEPKLYIGASAGANGSRMLFLPSVRQSLMISPMAGAIFRVDTESFAGIQVELNYSGQGWKEKFEGEQVGLAYERRLHYIEMPLLSHLYYKSSKVKLFLNIGPKIGYQFASAATQLGEGFTETQLKRYAMEIKRRFEWGLAVGPGLSFDAGKLGLLELEGRFFYGFSDIFPNRQQDFYKQSSEMVYTLKLNYLFPL